MTVQVIKNDGKITGLSPAGKAVDLVQLTTVTGGTDEELPEQAFVWQATMPAGFNLSAVGAPIWPSNPAAPLVLKASDGAGGHNGFWVRFQCEGGVPADESHPEPLALNIEFDDSAMLPEAGGGSLAASPGQKLDGTDRPVSTAAWHYRAKVSWVEPDMSFVPPPDAVVNAAQDYWEVPGLAAGATFDLDHVEVCWDITRTLTAPAPQQVAPPAASKTYPKGTDDTGFIVAPAEPTSIAKATGHVGTYRNVAGNNMLTAYARAVYTDGKSSNWVSVEEQAPVAKNPEMTVDPSNTVTARQIYDDMAVATTNRHGMQTPETFKTMMPTTWHHNVDHALTSGGYPTRGVTTTMTRGPRQMFSVQFAASRKVPTMGVDTGPIASFREFYCYMSDSGGTPAWMAGQTNPDVKLAASWGTAAQLTASVFASNAAITASYVYFYWQRAGTWYKVRIAKQGASTNNSLMYAYSTRAARPGRSSSFGNYRSSSVWVYGLGYWNERNGMAGRSGNIPGQWGTYHPTTQQFRPNGDFATGTAWGGAKPGNAIIWSGNAKGTVITRFRCYGIYGGKTEYFGGAHLVAGAAGSQSAGTNTHGTRVVYRHGKISTAVANLNAQLVKVGPGVKNGVPLNNIATPDGAAYMSPADAKINRVDIFARSEPSYYGPSSPTRTWVVQKNSGGAWHTLAFLSPVPGAPGAFRAYFGAQPPRTRFRVMPYGTGWYSVVGRGHTGVITAASYWA